MEDRALTLDDTQGMFLLLGAGFLIGAVMLFSEIAGGCFKCCKKNKKLKRSESIDSNPRCHSDMTPREKLNSLQDDSNIRNFLINRNIKGSLHSQLYENTEDRKKVEMEDDERKNSLDQEIDKLFNIDYIFGEINEIENENEQIIEQNDKLTNERI